MLKKCTMDSVLFCERGSVLSKSKEIGPPVVLLFLYGWEIVKRGDDMAYIRSFLILLGALLLAACGPSAQFCSVDSVGTSYPDGLHATPVRTALPPLPAELDIGGKSIQVDQVVTGTLCEGAWEGVVYVPCEVEVADWYEDPLFLQDCDLEIAPGTVVYVAAHNNAAYFKGCSCHTGEDP